MKPPQFDPSWPDDVFALYRHDMQEIWDRSIAPQIWNQYHNQLDLYRRISNGRGRLDILDVGCAQGTLALLLAEDGHNVCAKISVSSFSTTPPRAMKKAMSALSAPMPWWAKLTAITT